MVKSATKLKVYTNWWLQWPGRRFCSRFGFGGQETVWCWEEGDIVCNFGYLISAKGVMDTVSIFKLIFMEHALMTVPVTNFYDEWIQNSLEHLYSSRLVSRSWKSSKKKKYCCSGPIHAQWVIQNPLQSYFSTMKVLLMQSFSNIITSEFRNSRIDSLNLLVMKRKIHTHQ
jgi:hypothetical protein